MAKSNNIDSVMGYAIGGLALYVVYEQARVGNLGADLQKAALSIGGIFKGGAGTPGTSTPPKSGGCAFIPGYQYVADLGDGQWVVVWKGAEYLRYTSKTMAEEAYNQLCAGGG